MVGFLYDSGPVGETVLDLPILGPVASMIQHWAGTADQVIVAIGSNSIREKLMMQLVALDFDLVTVVHPQAIVSPSAVLGAGSVVMAGAIVGTDARLGVGSIVNCGAVVDHHATVEDYGHLGVSASMAGGTALGRGAWMQAGSALGYGVNVTAGEVLLPGAGRESK